MSSSPALSDLADRASPAPASQRDEDAQVLPPGPARAGRDRHPPRPRHRPPGRPRARPSTRAGRPACPRPAPAAAPELSIAFERVARTIRRTIALARKLAEPAPQARAAEQAHQRRTAARKQIIRDLEDTIHREAHGRAAETEALHAELYERLDTLDLDDDLDTLPIAEIIAALRRDLGLDPHRTTRGISPWKRRRPQDVRALLRPRGKAQRGGPSRRPNGAPAPPRAAPAPRHRPATSPSLTPTA